jgi:hypothetical protein
MLDDKNTPSRMRTFRFNAAMEKDLSFLMDLWGCTATDALARALTNANTLERIYAIQTNVKRPHEDKQAAWKAELENRIYTQPVASIQSMSDTLDDESLNLEEASKRDTIIENEISAPEQPAERIIRPAAAESAQDKPKRLQVRIFIKGEKKPCKTFSSYDRASLDYKANQWLQENGYPVYTVSDGTSFRWEV